MNPTLAARALLVMACPLAYGYATEPSTPVAPPATPQAKDKGATNGDVT